MLKLNVKTTKNIKAWLWVFVWFLVAIVLGGLTGAFGSVVLSKVLTNTSLINTVVGVLSYGMVLLVLVVVLRKFWKQKDVIAALGMRGHVGWEELMWAAVAGIAYFAFSWGIIYLLAKLFYGFDPNAMKLYDRSQVSTQFEIGIGLLQVAILTPIIEEIVFRGYLFGELAQFKMPIVWVVIMTSVVFGALHYPPLVWVVDTSIFGLVLGVLRYKTKTIWPGLILHIAVNVLGFFTLFVVK